MSVSHCLAPVARKDAPQVIQVPLKCGKYMNLTCTLRLVALTVVTVEGLSGLEVNPVHLALFCAPRSRVI